MKKKFDLTAIQNELQSGSAFFQKSPSPTPSASSPPKKKPVEIKKWPPVRKTERTENRTEKRSVPFPLKRSTKRYSFEFYTDQLATLKKLEGQAMMTGKGFNKSDFVRRALDDYFRKVAVELVKPQE